MNSYLRLTLTAVAAATLSACAFDDGLIAPTALTEKTEVLVKKQVEAPRVIAQVSRASESEAVHIPVSPRKATNHPWLKNKRVKVSVGKEAVALSEVLRSLSSQGVSITSELPLDRYNYAGYSLSDVDAETALKAVLGSVGLDFTVNDVAQVVQVTPMSSRTWYLNIGKRNSKFSSGTTANTTISQGGLSAGSNLTSGGGNVTSTQTNEDFWGSLKTELDSRMQVMVPEAPKDDDKQTAVASLGKPAAGLPELVAPAGGAAPLMPLPPTSVASTRKSDGLLNLVSKQIGSYSLNPETGAVTVRAPFWVRDELDTYFKRVEEMYNMDMLFEGQLLVLTTNAASSEGLDITSFGRFAQDNYGLTYTNNALGGLTLGNSIVNGLRTVTAASPSVAGPTLGIVSAVDGLAVFNAYLSNKGRVNVIQSPTLATTSGVPADFRRIVTKYFNNISQEVTPGTATSPPIITTKNTLVPQDVGTVLRVNPRVDISTGLIRAQIELLQTTETGQQKIPQAISGGANADLLTLNIPVLSKVVYSGEALLQDGNLVVMGGQVEESESDSKNGVTGLMESPALAPVFGKAVKEKTKSVFYFALKVTTTKR